MYELQEIKIRGKVYPAVFNVAALKEVGARYGGVEQLGDKLKQDYGKAIDEFTWIIALLLKQGVALKNFEDGTNDQPLTRDEVELLMSPSEIFQQQAAIVGIISAGMDMGTGTQADEKEEVDEVLEEVLKTKNGEGAGGK
jgi:hypothetical protein